MTLLCLGHLFFIKCSSFIRRCLHFSSDSVVAFIETVSERLHVGPQHRRLHVSTFYPTASVSVLVNFALKVQVIRPVFSKRIPNSQSPLVVDNALNCSE